MAVLLTLAFNRFLDPEPAQWSCSMVGTPVERKVVFRGERESQVEKQCLVPKWPGAGRRLPGYCWL